MRLPYKIRRRARSVKLSDRCKKILMVQLVNRRHVTSMQYAMYEALTNEKISDVA